MGGGSAMIKGRTEGGCVVNSLCPSSVRSASDTQHLHYVGGYVLKTGLKLLNVLDFQSFTAVCLCPLPKKAPTNSARLCKARRMSNLKCIIIMCFVQYFNENKQQVYSPNLVVKVTMVLNIPTETLLAET